MRLIDADALEKALEKEWDTNSDSDFANKCVWRVLENAPTVELERKKGEWIDVQFRTIPYNRIDKAKKCSECGKRKDKYVVWNFCPNCGCEMER